MVVRTENITKRFGGLHAVRDVSIEVRAGQCMGILGPNGAGKTTLLNLVGGTALPDSGRVVLDGEDVTGSPVRAAGKGLARCFQDLRLVPELAAWLNVVAGLRGFWPRRRDAYAWLDRVGIAHLGNARTDQLSYGQQKLVSLARALARSPRILLLDEIAAGLDRNFQDRMIGIVREFVGNGGACVSIEHDVGVMTRVADDVILMASGQVRTQLLAKDVAADATLREVYIGA